MTTRRELEAALSVARSGVVSASGLCAHPQRPEDQLCADCPRHSSVTTELWGAFRDDTGELLVAHPGDCYEAKHAAMDFEREHGVPCSWRRVEVTWTR